MDPLAVPFFSTFHNPHRASTFTQFSEIVLNCSRRRFVLLENGTVGSEETPSRRHQIILRVAVVIFATLLVLPLICMMYAKWKNRYMSALEAGGTRIQIELTRIREEALEGANEIYADRAGKLRKDEEDFRITAKLKRTETAQAIEDIISSEKAALDRLPQEGLMTWYKDSWIVKNGLIEVSYQEGVEKERGEYWTLERRNPQLNPKLTEITKSVNIILKDGSSIRVLQGFLKGTCLERRLRYGRRALDLDRIAKERAKKEKSGKEEREAVIHRSSSIAAETEIMVPFEEYSVRSATLYLELMAGGTRIENISIEDLLQLCALADCEMDDRFKRILLELFRSLIAYQQSFFARILQQYVRGIYSEYPPDLFKYFIEIDLISAFSQLPSCLSETERKIFAETVLHKRAALKEEHIVDVSIEYLVYILLKSGSESEKKEAEGMAYHLRKQTAELLQDSRLNPWDHFVIGLQVVYNFIDEERFLLAQSFFEKAREIRQAKYYLAICFLKTEKAEELRTLHEAAHEGDYIALRELASYYAKGKKGLSKDLEISLFLSRLAFLNRTISAIENMARILGTSMIRNDAEIVMMYESIVSADPSNVIALKKLGKYWCRLAPAKDYKKSFDYFSQAALLENHENRDTNIFLGLHHHFGWGIPRNPVQARILFGGRHFDTETFLGIEDNFF